MRPIKSPPSLGTINGFGVTVVGKRDFDRETGTYIKTHCFSALFIPIIPLGAYRVADAPGGGWYFLGKERVSGVAKVLTALMILAVVGLISTLVISGQKNSKAGIAKRKLAEAQAFEDSEEYLKAARVYEEMIDSHSIRTADAKKGLNSALAGALNSSSDSAVGVLQLIGARHDATEIAPEIVSKARQFSNKVVAEKPGAAIDALDAVVEHVDASAIESFDGQRLGILEKLTTQKPDDAGYAVRLAIVYERQEEYDKLEPLLAPHLEKLGDSEGARILGQVWAAQGNWDGSYPLLKVYLKDKLSDYHKAEKALMKKATALEKKWIDHLDTGQGPKKFYRDYENEGDVGKQRLVTEYVMEKIDKDEGYKRAQERVLRANRVISVAIDFGMVQLNRAQSIEDPAERKSLLEEAEKTFLSVQSSTGESNETSLFLAQVNFWLGKNTEADALFEQILASNSRDFSDLMTVASVRRDLGDQASARKLLEESYDKAPAEARSQIAQMRAVTNTDIEDGITWWRKADRDDPIVQVQLANSLGAQAQEAGDEDGAVKHYRESIAGYKKQPESATVFNNMSLVYMRLAPLTGDSRDYEEATKLLSRAAKMSPSDAILISNLQSLQLRDCVRDLFESKLDMEKFHREIGFESMSALYHDSGTRREAAAGLAKSEHFAPMLENLQRILILAPKSKNGYTIASEIYQLQEDTESLSRLRDKIRSAELDFGEELAGFLTDLDTNDDGERLAELKPARDRYAALVKGPEVAQDPLGRVIVVSTYAFIELAAHAIGADVDVDALIGLVGEVFEATPNGFSQGVLTVAHAAAAMEELTAADADLAKDWERFNGHLQALNFIALHLERGGPTADAIAANPHTQEMIKLLEKVNSAFPESPNPNLWACLKHTDSEGAKSIAAGIAADKVSPIEEEITFLLNPLDTTTILDRYWRMKVNGQSDEAEKFYEDALKMAPLLPEL